MPSLCQQLVKSNHLSGAADFLKAIAQVRPHAARAFAHVVTFQGQVRYDGRRAVTDHECECLCLLLFIDLCIDELRRVDLLPPSFAGEYASICIFQQIQFSRRQLLDSVDDILLVSAQVHRPFASAQVQSRWCCSNQSRIGWCSQFALGLQSHNLNKTSYSQVK
ncbi:hypothetical protein TYRP_013207 [Tyrophagus putrescentiae]|nr:hypothetical protein TYRP_013207 [Tyrophagus putrescentiae]